MRVAASRRCLTAKRPSGAAFLLSFVSAIIFLDHISILKIHIILLSSPVWRMELRAAAWVRQNHALAPGKGPRAYAQRRCRGHFLPHGQRVHPLHVVLPVSFCGFKFYLILRKKKRTNLNSPCYPANFDIRFRLTYRLILREKELHFNIGIYNPSKDLTFSFNLLLHTYFKVPDVRRCQITGLHGCTFIDKVCSH